MNDHEKLNYYELLEVPVNASLFEIRHAYRNALSIYGEDSLSTYSLFSDEEREKLLKSIENAFQTLIDEEKKIVYNKKLVDSGEVDPSEFSEKGQSQSIPIFQAHSSIDKNFFFKKIKKMTSTPSIQDLIKEIQTKALISGKDLKKLRKAIGIEREEIFEVARISMSILNAIENDQFQNLPSLIYLRNFLKSYAEILHLDPKIIVDNYIINISLLQK